MKKYFMPVGKSDFEKIRKDGDYYIDKTGLIQQIIENSAEVTLFTRPRRFGKTLNMSMLEHFFDIRKDSKSIFEGLEISKNTPLCDEWMNRYPTIFISFKDMSCNNFEGAVVQFKTIISNLYKEYAYILDNQNIDEDDKDIFKKLKSKSTDIYEVSEALFLLSKMMYQYYQKTVVMLIDEYDVPMSYGSTYQYYEQIIEIMKLTLSKALKDNPYLKFAALTGCLRIAKESIFTGLNNLYVDTISGNKYNEFFGFTESEVDKLLSDTELTPYKFIVKDWYDGYRFGRKEIYCPWDVLNYVSELQDTPGIAPKDYWSNTSSNDIIRQYLESNLSLNDKMEMLIRGESIEVELNDSVTYRDLTSTEENFWSVLYATGYLTTVEEKPENILETYSSDMPYIKTYRLKLVNKEIKSLFVETISKWFKENIIGEDRTVLFNAVWKGDADTIADEVSGYLNDTISYFDYHENFYHAFLAGLFSGVKGISVESNRESGTGRADVIVKYPKKRYVAIFELKKAETDELMEKYCQDALKQIEEKKYASPYRRETVFKYGVSFHEKNCLVKKG